MTDSADQGWEGEADLKGLVAGGRYRVVTRIGRGTIRDVYEAEHVELGTHVALKVLRSEHAESEAAARFLREGKTLGLFRHRNIVELLEVGRLDDGSLFLATELVRGVTLRDLMSRGVLDQRRVLLIMRQVLEALTAAHAVGVIHRDIKPETIMLDERGDERGADLVKMLDFGVAKLFTDTATTLGESKLTKLGITALGSPRYISPECVVGGEIDERSDLYSTGAVLFELLTGKPLFYDEDPSKLMRLHAYAPAMTLQQRAPDRRFTPQLEFLVSEALGKKPDLRFRSAAEMASALDAAIHSLDVAAEAANASRPPAAAIDNSFAILAEDYRPPIPPKPARPDVTPVMDRNVRPAGVQLRVRGFARRHWPKLRDPARRNWQRYWPKLRDLVRTHKMIALSAAGTLVIVIVIIAVVAGGGSSKHTSAGNRTAKRGPPVPGEPAPDLARRARELLAAGSAKQAADLVETELAGSARAGDGPAYLVLGHARMAMGRRLDALSAYERAIKLDASFAEDAELRANADKVLAARDIAAALVALEVLAALSPPAHDSILAAASGSKVAEVRHRAFAIAEREGIADKIDRLQSWSLDLSQATGCDDRRAAVAKLSTTADRRAIPVLKRVKVHKCVERDATEAIARIEATK